MKRYLKEIIVFIIQVLALYILPLFSGPTDIMGLVWLLIMITFILPLILGVVSTKKVKYLYPIAVAAVFIPSVFIYYNETALVHALWYLVVSAIGLAIGSLIRWITHISKKATRK